MGQAGLRDLGRVVRPGAVATLLTVFTPFTLFTRPARRLARPRRASVTLAVVGLAPLAVVVLADRSALAVLWVVSLVTAYRTAMVSREHERQLLHDALTGLPNRTLLARHGRAALTAARRRRRRSALFLLDLDRFKVVNDTLGHRTGDRLLRLAAERLDRVLGPSDTVARLGGDEFGVLLPFVPDAAAAKDVARRVAAAFAEPFHLDGFVLDSQASVGVALSPDDATDFETLLQRAEVAMYLAKASRSGVEVYAAERDGNTIDRLALAGELRRALDDGVLDLHYQPKVAFFGGDVIGVEALLRWDHDSRGQVEPEAFLDVAEQCGLAQRLTAYVVDTALAQAARWWRRGIAVPIAVNVSLRDVDGRGFVSMISTGLRRHAVPPAALQLEITERVLVTECEAVTDTLAGLDRLGVRISLDDFGTGYSSLAHLRGMPVSEVKVDRSFVRGLVEERQDALIVRSTVELAHSLGVHVVAEGVEDEVTWQRLRELGCDAAQGWLVAAAMPPDVATAWLEAHAPRRWA